MSDYGRDYDHDKELGMVRCGVCKKRHEIGICFPKTKNYRDFRVEHKKPPFSWIVEEWKKEGRL